MIGEIAAGAVLIPVATAVWWWRNRRGLRRLTEEEAAELAGLLQQMERSGLGALARHLHVIGIREMPGTNALTEPGFMSIGRVVILGSEFFRGNNGDPPLRTLIHEALHCECGLLRTMAEDSPAHERLYEWADRLYRGSPLPSNLRSVIVDGAAPVLPARGESEQG